MTAPVTPEVFSLSEGLQCYCSGGRYIALLGSQRCYFLPLENQRRQRDLRELTYELEDDIPLDAESMSIGLVGNQANPAAIACNGQNIADELRSDERLEGLKCIAVVPEIALAIAHCSPRIPASAKISLEHGFSQDQIAIEAGAMTAWSWKSTSGETQSVAQDDNPNSPQAESWISRIVGFNSTGTESEVVLELGCDWASPHAQRLLDGKAPPIMNLHHGPLAWVNPLAPARRSSVLAGGAVLLLMFACAGAMWLRAVRYRSHATQMVHQQAEVFDSLFPGQSRPVGLMSWLQSERRRLLATRGADEVPDVGSTLPVMQAFLAGIPADCRFNISMLHFGPDRVFGITLKAKSYADLDAIRSGLSDNGFDIPPTSSQNSNTGVTTDWKVLLWSPALAPTQTEDSRGIAPTKQGGDSDE